jgi:Fic family protein
MPTQEQTDKLIISGLMEEAISSSQIEGANTTRKVAKAMIELKRQPKNKDERMILNNYKTMIQLEDWKSRSLNDQFLLELHTLLTSETMDHESDVGRFRRDEDEIVVSDKMTGEVVHIPPKAEASARQLKQLYKFAHDDSSYIHPFVKASILHFAIGYIHPFVDGNGRSARAIFYWYLIRKNYWMFKFLPISLQIKKKEWRSGYDRAFQQVESDELDLTYFINYKIALACNAIDDLTKYLARKEREANQLKKHLIAEDEINNRQLELITLLQSTPNAEIDVEFYRSRNGVVYETARKFVYSRGENFPSK